MRRGPASFVRIKSMMYLHHTSRSARSEAKSRKDAVRSRLDGDDLPTRRIPFEEDADLTQHF